MDKKEYYSNEAAGVVKQKELPDFQRIAESLNKISHMTSDMNRRSKQALNSMFGMLMEDSDKEDKGNPTGFVGQATQSIDEIFDNLNSIQNDLNKMNHELGNDKV